jgi:hypothetical protein
MSGDLIYIGVFPSSDASRYKDRRFSHTSNGVNYYDCWKLENKIADAFGDKLDITKVKAVEQVFEQPIDESVFELKFKKI